MTRRRPQPANPTAFMVVCAGLAAIALSYGLYALVTHDPAHRLGLAGLVVGPILLYFMYAAHHRSHGRSRRADAQPRGAPLT